MRTFHNILIQCLVNMGDVILATSAIALLKQACPEAKVTIMVKPVVAELMLNNPVLDDVIVLKYKEKEKSWRSMWRFTKELRSRHFDLSISFDRKLRPALLGWMAGIPVRLVPDRVFDNKPSWVTKLFTHIVHTPDDFMHTHQAEIFQSIIREFFDCQGSAQPVIAQATEANRSKAKKLLSIFPDGRKKIALCVKGTYYLKNWPLEKFAELIELLDQRYKTDFFIVGAPEDKEYAEQLKEMTKVPVENFCGQTSLLDLVALLEQSDLFITIDTGGMHIAATTQIPIIGLFRCVSTHRWRPISPKGHAIDFRLADCPDVKNPEDCPKNYCIKNIPIEEVYTLAVKLLDGGMA